MTKLIDASSVEHAVRRYLQSTGCSLSQSRKQGETGSDIIAKLGDTN
jgi:HJR/Mrr/RecB family endonuclease